MQAVLFLTHVINDYTLYNYRKLKSELNPNEYDVIMILNNYNSEFSDFDIPNDVKYIYQNKTHMQEFIDKGHDFRFNYDKLKEMFKTNVCEMRLIGHYYELEIKHENEEYNQTFNSNLALIHFFLHNETKYTHYWYVEYDVLFKGDSSVFFDDMTQNFSDYDFLSQNILHFYEVPWFPLFCINNKYTSIDKYRQLKSFDALCRFSHKALECIWDSMNSGNNTHFEIMWPTSCYENDLEIGTFDGLFMYKLDDSYFNKYTNIYCFNGDSVNYNFIVPTSSTKIYHPVKDEEKANEILTYA